jgi:hypothetical protein
LGRKSHRVGTIAFDLSQTDAVLERISANDCTRSMLDIGCGVGQYARVDVREYIGSDLNPRYVARASAAQQDGPAECKKGSA